MHSEDNIINHGNSISGIEFKDEHVNDLMNSIENKLSMLACDDSIGDFSVSKITSPKKEVMTTTNEKKYHNKMHIN